MATNRDILFTIKVKNASAASLAQIGQAFRKNVPHIQAATRAITEFEKKAQSASSSLNGLTNASKAVKALTAALKGVTGHQKAFDNLGKSMKGLTTAIGPARVGLKSFTTTINAAKSSATAFNNVANQTVKVMRQMGSIRPVNVRFTAPAAAPVPGAAPVNPRANASVNRATSSFNAFTHATQGSTNAIKKFSNSMTQTAAAVSLVHGPLGGIASRLTALGTLFNTTGTGAGILIAGLAGMGTALGFAIAQGKNLEDQQRRLQATLIASGNVANQSVQSIESMVNRIAESSTLSDDAIRQAAIQLTAFGSIGEESFERVLKASADMASLFDNGDVEGAVQRFGKAFEDPVKGIDALRKSGVTLSNAQQIQIEDLVRHGKTLEAQNLILSEAEKSFKGLADAAGSGLTGAFNLFRKRLDDLFETLSQRSGLLVSTEIIMRGLADGILFLTNNIDTLLPALKALLGFMLAATALKVIPAIFNFIGLAITRNLGPLKALTVAWKNYGIAQQIAVTTGRSTISVLKGMQGAATGVGPPLVAAAASGGLFATAFTRLQALGGVPGILKAIGAGLLFILNPLKSIPAALALVTKGLRLLTAAALTNPFTALAAGIVAATAALIFYKDETFNALGKSFQLVDLLTVLWEDFRDFIIAAMTAIKDRTTKEIVGIYTTFRKYFDLILDYSATWVDTQLGYYVGFAFAVIQVIKEIYNGWGDFFSKLLTKADLFAQAMALYLTLQTTEARNALKKAGEIDLFDGLKEGLTRIQNEFKRGFEVKFATGVVNTIKSAFDSFIKDISELGSYLSGKINDFVGFAFQSIVDRAAARSLQRQLAEYGKAISDARIAQLQGLSKAREADLAALKDYIKGLQEEFDALNQTLVLQNLHGRALEKTTALYKIAAGAIKAGITEASPHFDVILEKMEAYSKLWDEVEKTQRGTLGAIRGIRAAFTEFIDSSTNTFEIFKELTTSFIDDLTDRWVNFTQTGQFNFKEMLDNMAAQVQRFTFRYSLAKILEAGLPKDQALNVKQIFGLASQSETAAIDLLTLSATKPMHVFVTNPGVAPAGSILPGIAPSQQGGAQEGDSFWKRSGLYMILKSLGLTGESAPAKIPAAPTVSPPAPEVVVGSRDIAAQFERSGAYATLKALENSVKTTVTSVNKGITSSFGDFRDDIVRGFADRGFSRPQITGIMAGLQAESGLNPNAVNPKSGATGILQALGPRLEDLQQVANAAGKSVKDASVQVDHLFREVDGLMGTEKARYDALKAQSKTATQSLETFIKTIERPSPGADTQGDLNRGNRAIPQLEKVIIESPQISALSKDLKQVVTSFSNTATDTNALNVSGFDPAPVINTIDDKAAALGQTFSALKDRASNVMKTFTEFTKLRLQEVRDTLGGAPELPDVKLREPTEVLRQLDEFNKKTFDRYGEMLDSLNTLDPDVVKRIPSLNQFGVDQFRTPEDIRVDELINDAEDKFGQSIRDIFTKGFDRTKFLRQSNVDRLGFADLPGPVPQQENIQFDTTAIQDILTNDLNSLSEVINDATTQSSLAFKGVPQKAFQAGLALEENLLGVSEQLIDGMSDGVAKSSVAFKQVPLKAHQAGLAMEESLISVSEQFSDGFTRGSTAFQQIPEKAHQIGLAMEQSLTNASEQLIDGMSDGVAKSSVAFKQIPQKAQQAGLSMEENILGVSEQMNDIFVRSSIAFQQIPNGIPAIAEDVNYGLSSFGDFFTQDLPQAVQGLPAQVMSSVDSFGDSFGASFAGIGEQLAPTVTASINDAVINSTTIFKDTLGTGIVSAADTMNQGLQYTVAGFGDTLQNTLPQLQAGLGTAVDNGIGSLDFSTSFAPVQDAAATAASQVTQGFQYSAEVFGNNVASQVQNATTNLGDLSTGFQDSFSVLGEQFTGQFTEMLAPLQDSVANTATNIQLGADQIAASGQYTAMAFQNTGAQVGTSLSSIQVGAQQAASGLQSAGAGAAAASGGASSLGSSASSAAGQVSTLGSSAASAGTQMRTAGGNSSGGFGGLLSSILGSVGGMIKGVAGQIFGIVQSLFGSLMGMLGGGGGGGLGGLLGGLFHDGGLVTANPEKLQLVAKSAFRNAKRYHKGFGLKPDEIPAIFQQGEIVLSKKQVHDIKLAQGKRDRPLDYDWRQSDLYSTGHAMQRGHGRETGTGARIVNVKQYITAPDPAAFNEARGNIARKTFSAMSRMNQRNS